MLSYDQLMYQDQYSLYDSLISNELRQIIIESQLLFQMGGSRNNEWVFQHGIMLNE